MTCVACDDAVAFGDACQIEWKESIEKCAVLEEGVCVECAEGFFSELDACQSCSTARRCVDTATHLMCEDDALLSGATCGAGLPPDALLATGNHVVKCGAGHFVQPGTCGACQEGCVACRDGMSSDICDVMTGVC